MTRPITQRLAQFATAGAVTAFASSLARHHPDTSTAAESGFLALILGITLTALALSSRTATAVVPGGALIALALCFPAAEGTRGALIMVLLVATLSFATWRTFAGEVHVAWVDIAALTIAWQGVLRSERLLEWQGPSWRSMVWLIALPLAAATAAWWHSRRHGGATSLVLLASISTLAPGLGVVSVAVLTVAAVLTGEHGRSRQAAAVAAGACALAIWWLPGAGPPLLLLVTALALRHHRLGAWLPAVGALVWAVIAISATGGSFAALGWLLLAMPLAVLAPAASRPLLLTSLALTLTHGPASSSTLLTDPALLAPALALAALALPVELSSRRLQAGWSLTLFALVAVGAAYPWLRHPLSAPTSNPVPVLLGVLAVVLGYSVVHTATKWPTLPRWRVTLTLLGLVVLVATLSPPRRLNVEPIVLTSRHGTWAATPTATSLGTLTVDSLLTGGRTPQALRPGQPVVHLLLTPSTGGPQQLELRYGQHTGYWSARRLDPEPTLAPPSPLAAPSPWLTWYGGDGTLAQRYRATWRLDAPLALERIELVRAEGLAPGVEVTILSVAAR